MSDYYRISHENIKACNEIITADKIYDSARIGKKFKKVGYSIRKLIKDN